MSKRVVSSYFAKRFCLLFTLMAFHLLWNSVAHAYSNQWEWSVKLINYNAATTSDVIADCYQPHGSFSTREAALAAARAACDSLIVPQPSQLTHLSVTGIGSSTVTYRYTLPPSAQATQADWIYDPQGVNGVCCVAGYPDEASYYEGVKSHSLFSGPEWISTLEQDWTTWQISSCSGSPRCVFEGRIDQNKIYRFSLSTDLPGQCAGLYQNCIISLKRLRLSWCPAGYYAIDNGTGYITSCTPFENAIEITGHPLTSTCTVGDPCDVATGDNEQTVSDYSFNGLALTRYYHSLASSGFGTLGERWSHNYDARLILSGETPLGLIRPNGFQESLKSVGDHYISEMESGLKVQRVGANWVAYRQDGTRESYDAGSGKLLSINDHGRLTTLSYSGDNLSMVVDSFGHSLSFQYDGNGRLSAVLDPAGVAIQYIYDATSGMLAQVTYQDGKTRTYAYENATFPNYLTGIIDENGVRVSMFEYDSMGRVTLSQEADGANRISLTYDATSTTVTDARGTTSTYQFTNDAYSRRVTSITTAGQTVSTFVPNYSTDFQRRPTSTTDANGVMTTYIYDQEHLISKTEAANTEFAKTTSYSYGSNYSDLPTFVTESGRTTATSYDSNGNVLTTTMTDTATGVSRTWTYTYNAYGQVLTEDGPRTDVNDVTTYIYLDCSSGAGCGQLQTITNALGQTVTYSSYNAYGQPLAITDANGVVTTLTYDARQRVLSRTVGGETTAFAYTPTGLLQQVVLPDGSAVQYGYDVVSRLTQIQDADGNRVVYTLDSSGNRTAGNVYDSGNTLRRTRTSTFNELNQLYQDIKAANTAEVTTKYTYDGNGNRVTVHGPMMRITTNRYDALNRLTQSIDAIGGVISYAYDANGNQTQVTDPRNLVTSYIYNGFSDLTQVVSPDSGIAIYSQDAAGNLTSRTDARGQNVTYQYDALNRVTVASYSDQTLSYVYDTSANGNGRLSSGSDAAHGLSYSYDAQGRITGKTQAIGAQSKTVNYSYSSGRLTQLTTPSGQAVTYGYSNGKVTSIAVNGQALLSQVLYAPFDSPEGWTWGNGTLTVRQYDQDGQLTTIDSAGLSTYTFNPDGSIATRQDDNSGDIGLSIGTTTLDIADTSNRLTTVTGDLNLTNRFDAVGNILRDGTRRFTYNGAGRLATAVKAGETTTYLYNALGQRIQKSNSSETITFIYDEQGHLLGEYDGTGNLIQELVWLNDIPVATIRAGEEGIGVFYIHTDHLNAPSKITRPTDNQVVWRWDHDPYGNGVPNQDPDGNGAIVVFNLRFPGQYFDSETGLNYNYYRDYDPALGRYMQSDPIGLSGGSFSTYAYVGGNPLSYIDPDGLDVIVWNNTSGGRSRSDGPTNGNWGGKCWSGGKYSCGKEKPGDKPPTDSADQCYKRHDDCYVKCGGNKLCAAACNKTLVKELEALPSDSSKWPSPPRSGTESDSERYRKYAITWFKD